ncbi:hypothetical protein Ahy_B10g102752 [Arachis hypogaea]|uniref:Putative plant transposon protein domain-containing protein n=1 Tax=Arachis hypogaea TaxID=3818 RepID=A0A444X2K0_ARAHY|nr:hypothetical protein Ahy_B10g102752 [Arachis hypogaea]
MVTTSDQEIEDKQGKMCKQPEDNSTKEEERDHKEPEISQQELLKLYAPFPQLLNGKQQLPQLKEKLEEPKPLEAGADWESGAGNKPKFIKRTDLTPEAKGWFELVRRSILPAANNSEVNLERATMLHCILKGGEIKVHEIIAQGIRKMAEKSDSRGTLGYRSTIYRICKKARVVFEDEDPIWIKEGIPITVRRMNAAALPLPQRKQRKRIAPQVVEGQVLEGQVPQTFDMNQLQEAIDGLSRQYLESQGAQKVLQLQMMGLGYLVGQLPILHPGIAKYDEMKDELARKERQRVEESHESVRKELEDWKQARLARMQGNARGNKEDKQGKERGHLQQ